MNAINPYIGFKGRCREAMTFYQECLGGKLELQEIPETAVELKPDVDKKKIFHSSLTINGYAVIMGSDMEDQSVYTKGNNIALGMGCSSEEEIYNLFEKLSKEGKVFQGLREEFWGAIFGSIENQFGIKWMLNFNKEKK